MVAAVDIVKHNARQRISDGDGSEDEITFFIYAGRAAWQLVEEYPSAVPTWGTTPGEEDHDTGAGKSYVYGLYIDEVLSMRDHLGADYFYLQDDLYSVYALADAAGAVVERYEYGDYDQVSITAEDGTPRSSSAYGNRYTFTGRLLDDELTLDDGSRILQYRHRYMATGSGRFLQRDPIEILENSSNQIGLYRNTVQAFRYDPSSAIIPQVQLIPGSRDPRNHLNMFAFTGSSPQTYIDPYGLQCSLAQIGTQQGAPCRGFWGKARCVIKAGKCSANLTACFILISICLAEPTKASCLGALPVCCSAMSQCIGAIEYCSQCGKTPVQMPNWTHVVLDLCDFF